MTTNDELSAQDKNARMVAVGETAVLMSHCIKNLLQGINGGAHLVEIGLKNGDLALIAKGWNTVDKNQTVMSDLIANLLRLGKPLELVKIPVDLVSVTHQSLDKMSDLLHSCGVSVRVEEQTDSLNTNADVVALQLAIENLIRVTTDAFCMETERILDIRFEKSRQDVSLHIGYQGARICVDPDELAIPASPDDRTIGGIEFAVSRRIIRGHQGDIVLGKTSDRSHSISLTLPVGSDAQVIE